LFFFDDFHYFVIFIDAHTKYIWYYPLVASSSALICWVMSSLTSEPIALSDADRYKVWHDTMRDEIQALCFNNTWSLVSFHLLMNVVGGR
jgi:hypothetical protein